jgi:NAD(P)-dependent dehydrogenase (short-subunit alcohol dehydrogenase family)
MLERAAREIGMSNLSERVAMVTGAAGNLGQAVTRALVASHACTVLVDRDVAGLRRTFAGLQVTGRHLLAEATDLTSPAEAEAAVDRALARFGHLDVLINLAGAFSPRLPVQRTPLDTWRHLLDANLLTTVVACRAVVPAMQANNFGRIVTVAARSGLLGGEGLAAFAAAKAGVLRLTESLAEELKPTIAVNCVIPGTLDTPAARAERPEADHSKWVAPEAVADVILFLVSEEARAVNGAAIPVLGAG